MTISRTPLLQMFVAERLRIVGLIKRIVGCRATAEDLAQDTLLRLWARPLGEGDRSLLFRTAQNLALDHLRQQRVRVSYAHAETASAQDICADALQPDAAGNSAQEFKILLDALRTLPDRAQRIFLLNRVDGLSYAEISRHQNISVSTVEKEMMRALEVCRTVLAGRNAE